MAPLAAAERTGPAPAPFACRAGQIRPVAWETLEAPEARHAWDALTACASEPNPFYESWYLLPALRALDPEGRNKLLRFEPTVSWPGCCRCRREPRYYRWPIPHCAAGSMPTAFSARRWSPRDSSGSSGARCLAGPTATPGPRCSSTSPHLPLEGPLHDGARRCARRTGPPGRAGPPRGPRDARLRSDPRGLSRSLALGQEAQGTAPPVHATVRTRRSPL